MTVRAPQRRRSIRSVGHDRAGTRAGRAAADRCTRRSCVFEGRQALRPAWQAWPPVARARVRRIAPADRATRSRGEATAATRARRDFAKHDAGFTVTNHLAAVARRDDRQPPGLRFHLRHAEAIGVRRETPGRRSSGSTPSPRRDRPDRPTECADVPRSDRERRSHARRPAAIRSAIRRACSIASSSSGTPLVTDAVPTNSARSGRSGENAAGYAACKRRRAGGRLVRQRDDRDLALRHAGAHQRLARPRGIHDDPIGQPALLAPVVEVIGPAAPSPTIGTPGVPSPAVPGSHSAPDPGSICPSTVVQPRRLASRKIPAAA